MKKLVLLFILAAAFFFPGGMLRADGTLDVAFKLQDAFAKVAEKALPATVIIQTSKRIKQYYYLDPGYGFDRFTYRFFRRPGQIIARESPPIPSGQASGFIIDERGYILTNYHVVHDQSDFKVILYNKEEYKAEIVGIDRETDIAVLKIDAGKKLPYLKFADINTVKVGHYAIAIGAPFGLGHTVTVGNVSFKGRSTGMSPYENYIQTDAAINPGNSGGPLLNLKGEVIGVNDFILSPPGSQGNIGLGFAISCSLADHISHQIIAKGKADKPWIGITMFENTGAGRSNLGKGVTVAGVWRQSPAARADIRVNDVITKIDTVSVNEPQAVIKAIASHLPGDKVRVEVLRNNKPEVIEVKIGARPETLNGQNGWVSE